MVIEFVAYLPPIQSAIMLDGTGDNLQVKLNIPLKLSPDGIRLAGMTGKRLKVTIEEINDPVKQEGNRNEIPTRSEWQPERQASEREGVDCCSGKSRQDQNNLPG